MIKMEFETVILCVKNGTATLTFNRPKALNVLNSQLILELGQALEEVAVDENVRVLVITGGEKVFVAGGDIKEMMSCDSIKAKQYILSVHKVFNRLAEFPKPTIAAICGFSFGGGMELAAACDIRIAADDASFGFPEVKLGIFPAGGGSQRIPRIIGMLKTKELMFTGDTIDASSALAIGLINYMVPSEEVLPKAYVLAEKIGKNAPLALKALKESIHTGLDVDLASGLKQEIERACFLFSTEDQKEGMAAFVERRKPSFKGK